MKRIKRNMRIFALALAFVLLFQVGAVEIAKAWGNGTVTKKVYQNVYTGAITTTAKEAEDDEALASLTDDLSASPSIEETPVRIVEEVKEN